MSIKPHFDINLIVFGTTETLSGYFHNEGGHFHNI